MKKLLKFFKKKEKQSKASVVLTYTEEEAAMLFDLLHSEMNELMSINTKDRLSKEPLLNNEQREYLHRVMDFCAEQLKVLWKYDVKD